MQIMPVLFQTFCLVEIRLDKCRTMPLIRPESKFVVGEKKNHKSALNWLKINGEHIQN